MEGWSPEPGGGTQRIGLAGSGNGATAGRVDSISGGGPPRAGSVTGGACALAAAGATRPVPCP
ncbi:hypothetical protein Psuf_013370 [Phytohabitans suffuscus]|uniref:Uncharacterized protein n=1 Tax=Phytohabitans suffuscus TaxID=624315 RepID=A0A6F8YD12_9ACTN|nr:hypothetical protein Psuf_013370 [Phytohabitans suffuscus]